MGFSFSLIYILHFPKFLQGLQTTLKIKQWELHWWSNSKDSVLSAPQLPQPPGLRLASRPNNVQMSRGIPSSWCSRRSIPVWSNICFICWHATCWTRSEGSTDEGWARTHSPATPGDSSKLWNYKTGLETLKRKELSIQQKT